MSISFLNLLMLMGLAAVAIPPIIHLLNRRRYVVIDWGAMQFLQISDAKRRRLLIEELILMGLRMVLIAVMVLALAAPFAISPLFSSLGLRQNRDVVLIFGGSASMQANGSHESAKKWATEFVEQLAPGDSVIILQAKKQVVPVLPEPTSNFELAKKTIAKLPPPGGGCDWPQAVQEAYRLLEKSQRPLRNIILLGDGQRNGWSDAGSLSYWESLSDQVPQHSDIKPSVWVMNFDPKRQADPPNWSLAPIRARRVTAYVKQDIELQTDLLLHGQSSYQPPKWVHLEIDGDHDQPRSLRFPSKGEFEKERGQLVGQAGKPDLRKGQASKSAKKQEMLTVPLPPFKSQFKTPGSHLVSVIARFKSGREARQDFAVEVLALPVLIVDGDAKPTGDKRRSDFLRLAVDPRKDHTKEAASALVATVVPFDRFEPEMLNPPPDKKQPAKDPRVLILANVPKLTAAQQKGIEQFLAAGGGVLVTLGDHVEKNKAHYNDDLFKKGKGWLPARLERPIKLGTRRAASPLLASFSHSALELFRQESFGGLNDAYFPAWWQVVPSEGKSKAVCIARLTSKDPLLMEGNFKGGRVLLCTVPFMNSRDNKDVAWDSNLLRLPVFAPLVHEMAYYLAGNLSTSDKGNLQINYNLQPGQPLYYGLDGSEVEDRLTLATPGEKPQPLVFVGPRRAGVHLAQRIGVRSQESEVSSQSGHRPGANSDPQLAADRQLVDYEDTFHTGVYTLHVPRKETWLPRELGAFFNETFSPKRRLYYTVQSTDPAEFDLTPASAEDRAQVARQVPMTYETDSGQLLTTLVNQANTQELWWVMMLAVILLLCSEVWLTRRIVRAR